MALDADHLKINKFWGFDDPSFARVYKEIERMAQRAQASVQNRRNPSDIPSDPDPGNSELYDCLKDMAVKDPRDSLRDLRSRRGKRVENTCEWILAQRDFVAWRNGTVPQLLRLVGPPGIGKTMLSTFLSIPWKPKFANLPESCLPFSSATTKPRTSPPRMHCSGA